MSPRSNTILKSKKHVVTFAGKGGISRRIRKPRSGVGNEGGTDDDFGDSVDDDDGDDVSSGEDGDDAGDVDGSDTDDGGDNNKPKSKPRRPEPLPTGSDLFTTQQAATYLNCSPQLLDKLRHRGGGPAFVRLGGDLVRYSRVALDHYVASRTFKNVAQVNPSEYQKGLGIPPGPFCVFGFVKDG